MKLQATIQKTKEALDIRELALDVVLKGRPLSQSKKSLLKSENLEVKTPEEQFFNIKQK